MSKNVRKGGGEGSYELNEFFLAHTQCGGNDIKNVSLNRSVSVSDNTKLSKNPIADISQIFMRFFSMFYFFPGGTEDDL